MSRDESARLRDILAACEAIAAYVERSDRDEQIVFDAIRIRLVEIGEAVKDLGESVRSQEPGIPWSDVAEMRDLLTHRYFDTAHSIVMTTARRDIPELQSAAQRLLARRPRGADGQRA